MRNFSLKVLQQSWFEPFILAVILVNCTLIGVETYVQPAWIGLVQNVALAIFTFEILARWFARDSVKSFFTDAWNVFDLLIVLVSFVPESLFEDASIIVSIRVLRVFRVLRLLRAAQEVKLIVSVLVRSMSALTYNGLFFFIFMYLFSLIGLNLFQLPNPNEASPETVAKLEQYLTEAPNAPTVAPDPYGDLSESMFTLFRILTGEDWTDLRYNLIVAEKMGLIHSPAWMVTAFHVSWFVLSAFLLLNLLVGAILNNYQIIMTESDESNARS